MCEELNQIQVLMNIFIPQNCIFRCHSHHVRSKYWNKEFPRNSTKYWKKIWCLILK